jgi:hypothetical protein
MQGIPCNPHCTLRQPTPVGFVPFYIRHNTSTSTGDLVQASGNDLWSSGHGMVLSVALEELWLRSKSTMDPYIQLALVISKIDNLFYCAIDTL